MIPALSSSGDASGAGSAWCQASVLNAKRNRCAYSSRTFECNSFKSLDGGVTRECLGIDLFRIVAAPSSPATLYELGPAGSGAAAQPLYRSIDRGVTWVMVDAALPDPLPQVLTLLVDLHSGTLYLATDVNGVLSYTAP
jgi:hypothetical protein